MTIGWDVEAGDPKKRREETRKKNGGLLGNGEADKPGEAKRSSED